MRLTRLLTTLTAALLLAPFPAPAEPTIVKLWPGELPGPAPKTNGAEQDLTKPTDRLIAGRKIIKLANVSAPELHVFPAPRDKANGGAVIICPGGGFNILAWDLEGTEVAEWLNSIGFTAVVLKYRVPTAAHGETLNDAGTLPLKAVGPVMDAQRALSLTRSRAGEWALDPQRIGILGFSAGGATAGLAALLGDARADQRGDEPSCAANFALLIYPAYFFDAKSGGLHPWVKVTPSAPPTFLLMAQDDPINSENCTSLYSALTRAKVPAEIHSFTRGGHGYGLRATDLPVTQWPRLAEAWLRDRGFTRAATTAPR